MAHLKKEDSTLVGLLQAGSGNGDDTMRSLLRHTIQQVLEEELTAFLNAEPYIRTEERRGYRNGYKARVLKTRVGRLELMVPKDREGRFQTELFEEDQRSEKALVAAYKPHAVNVGVNIGRDAGAGVEGHLHIHLVPRWQGDTNFLSAIGKTRVLSEALEDSYDKLKRALESI